MTIVKVSEINDEGTQYRIYADFEAGGVKQSIEHWAWSRMDALRVAHIAQDEIWSKFGMDTVIENIPF